MTMWYGKRRVAVISTPVPIISDWQLTDPALLREIEGYASKTSVNTGEAISVFVNTAAPTFTLSVYRMGWYGGLGGSQVLAPVTLAGTVQTIPTPDPVTGLAVCTWVNPHAIDTTGYMTGVYLVKLTASTGKQRYVVFVVRDDASTARFMFQSSVTTYAAYNAWGGKSLYSVPTPAVKVSFDRPYDDGHPYTDGYGAGQLLFWEYPMIRWLEKNGYDCSYSTDVDTHLDAARLLQHKAFLSVGHDEYWSWEMRQNVEAARATKIHLAFFAANVCYWQIRFEDSSRTVVCYKLAAPTADPARLDPATYYLLTTQWRLPHVTLPGNSEKGLLGVEYIYGKPLIASDWKVYDASNWVFAGTGLAQGDILPGLLGYECDSVTSTDGTPPPAVAILNNEHPGGKLIAHSPFLYVNGHTIQVSDGVEFVYPGGAKVVALGTIQWAWGLDGTGGAYAGRPAPSAAPQKITKNILDAMSTTP